MKLSYLFRALTIIVALAVIPTAKAQIFTPQYSDSTQSAVRDSAITVSLLTAAPGREVYQLEGHSGLRIRTADIDVVANWGLFDFDTPNFVYRFVKGETDYCVGLIPYGYFQLEYRKEGRRLTEQILNLTPEQAWRLADMIGEAVRPENRTYRYNYVLDNCATRPIAYIERATGDSIHFPIRAAQLDEVSTFRSVMRHFHRNYPWYQFGIDIALGPGIDSPINIRQTGFAPVVLQEIAANATIGPDSLPLVKSTNILIDGPADGTAEDATPWYLTPLCIGWMILAVCAIVAWQSVRMRKAPRTAAAIYFAIAGLAGCVVAFLIFISSHEASSPNWIILWLNPLCLFVPALTYFSKGRRVLRLYMKLNLCLIGLYILTVAFGFQTANSAFLPLILADVVLSISYIYNED